MGPEVLSTWCWAMQSPAGYNEFHTLQRVHRPGETELSTHAGAPLGFQIDGFGLSEIFEILL